jgi:uncharacterized membrane protein YhhN
MSFETGLVLATWSWLAALVYWLAFCLQDFPGVFGGAVKALSTGLLALILWAVVAHNSPALWPVALGLTLGALGDWFLARRGEAAFLAGMAAFAAGHLAYAAGLLARSAEIGFDGLSGVEGAALLVLLGLLISTEVWLAPRTGALRWPVRAYVVMIGAMGIVLVLLPTYHGADILQLGGALFILSDLLLAFRLFVVKRKARQNLLSLTLWPVYWSGQALIGLGAMAFWSVKG